MSLLRTSALVLAAATVLSACSSTSTSTSAYRGPSVADARKASVDARKSVRVQQRELRAAKKTVAALERRIKRDENRLKRASTSRKAKLQARLRKAKRDLRKARRVLRNETRDVRRAERQQRLATARIDRARAGERRAARLAEARRIRDEARRKRLETKENAKLASLQPRRTRGLFSRVDPAYEYASDYSARNDGGWNLPAIPLDAMPKRLLRQHVRYRSSYKPGTVVVDTGAKYLYLIESKNRALRYGIGVGRQGFEWNGSATMAWKQKWPKWTPPEEMIAREPHLAKYCADCGGMPGGISNPLGARALYLHQGGVDTLYRLHGTPNWKSIGTAASSGCIRLINQDVIDLYSRVRNGATVVVK